MDDTVFEEYVTNLKNSDKKNRYVEYFSKIVFEGMIIVILTMFFGYYILLGYFLSLMILIPSPIPKIPDYYRIKSGEIILNKEKSFVIKKSYKLEIKNNFVAIYFRYREILRFYSRNPKILFKILCKIQSYTS